MCTIVIDTNIIAPSVIKNSGPKRRKIITYLTLLENDSVKIGVDKGGLIEKQYHKYIRQDMDLQNWWVKMQEFRLIDRYSIPKSKRGPYPDDNMHKLNEVDKMLLDIAAYVDSKILVTEDSDFYKDKTLKQPHPVVKKRGVKLKKFNESFADLRKGLYKKEQK